MWGLFYKTLLAHVPCHDCTSGEDGDGGEEDDGEEEDDEEEEYVECRS